MKKNKIKFKPGDVVKVKPQFLKHKDDQQLGIVLELNADESMKMWYFMGRTKDYHDDEYINCFELDKDFL